MGCGRGEFVMLNKLLQAIAITSAVYLTMLIGQPQRPSPYIEVHYPTAGATRLEYLLAEVINFLREPTQKRA